MEFTYHRRLVPILGAVALSVVAGCGTSTTSSSSAGGGGNTGSGSSSSSGGAANLASCQGTITVASDLPTSGGDASIGGGTEKGVKLAVTQANAKKLLGGCTINYIAKDDASAAKGKHDPQQGAQNMQELVANQAVVGVVGPFNSGVAVAELPISNAAGLTQISPSNTDPGLTIAGSDPDIATKSLQPSGKITYYRIISNDVVQAQVMANFAYKEKGLKNIYDIDDQETYGKDLSNYFDQFFQQLGGKIAKRTGLPGDTKDFRGALNEAKGLSVDGLFFGGVAANGSGIIKSQMKDVGLNAIFLSGDGTVDPQYYTDAGSTGDGNAFASSAPDATNLPSAATFNTDFKAAYSQDPVAYSAYGFDSMNILLDAIKAVLLANGGQPPSDPAQFRAAVVAQMPSEDWKGAIGETKFDKLGDTLNKAFTIYQATGGKWVGLETVSAPS
jgi:branched-chain amino acid transport system substrate-binding protein